MKKARTSNTMMTREQLAASCISVSDMGRLSDGRMPGKLLRETSGTSCVAGLHWPSLSQMWLYHS